MPKYKNKHVVIDAVQWTGSAKSLEEITSTFPEMKWEPGQMVTKSFYVKTLEGLHIALNGDYIIKGVNGEFYPCQPDIFEKIYEPYSEETTGLAFGEALEAMKAGKRVSRAGWNGKGMFAFYTPEERIIPCPYEQAKDIFTRTTTVRAGLMLKTAQDDLARWAPSCSDCLAEDWEILP